MTAPEIGLSTPTVEDVTIPGKPLRPAPRQGNGHSRPLRQKAARNPHLPPPVDRPRAAERQAVVERRRAAELQAGARAQAQVVEQAKAPAQVSPVDRAALRAAVEVEVEAAVEVAVVAVWGQAPNGVAERSGRS